MSTRLRIRTLLRHYLPHYGEPTREQVTAAVDHVWQALEPHVAHTPPSDATSAVTVASALRRKPQDLRKRWVTLAAAAVVAIAAVGIAIVWRPADNALFRVVEGKVHRQGGTVRSNGGGGAVLALADGSRVEMRSQSELSLERADDGLRIRLIRGGIIVDAATQRTGHLYVQTKDVTVSVVGTVFLVNADEQGSRVAVIEGEVRVQQGTTEKKLLPGEQVATSPAMAPAPITEEIAWSRNAGQHLALLRQVATSPAPQVQEPAPKEAQAAFEVISIRPTLESSSGGRGGGGGGRGTRRHPRGDNPCSLGGEPVVDPRRFEAVNQTVLQLASWAYGVQCWMQRGPDVLFGGPDWIRSAGFDVTASIPEGSPSYSRQQLRRNDAPVLQQMLKAMLEDRFNFVVRREMREMNVYVLSVASGGPKFTRVNAPARTVDAQGNVLDRQAAPGVPGFVMPSPDRVIPEFSVWQEGDSRSLLNLGPAEIHGRKRTMADLAESLWLMMGRPVLDRTGLKGDFNFFFEFAVYECPICPFVTPPPDARREPGAGPRPDRPLLSVLEQVGLEVRPSREQMEVLVIERVERPTEN